MRTIEAVLAELRAVNADLASGKLTQAQAKTTVDRLEIELCQHGIRIQPKQQAHPGGSRFATAGDGVRRPSLAERLASGEAKTVTRHGHTGSLASAMAGAKALAESTPSAGGVLVPPEVSSELVTLIRARVAVMAMSPTIVQVEKELDLPYISTGSTAYYVSENARIPVSEPTFALVPKLVPLELAALVPVSNRLLRDAQTNPSLEEALRTDMADALSGRQDLAFLMGLGGGAEPLGIRNQPNINVVSLGVNGAQPTLADFRKVIGTVRGRNATFTRPGWIFHPNVLTYLENLEDSTGKPLLEGDLLSIDATGGGGRFLGYPFRTTSRIPTALTVGTSNDATFALFSSDWQECWVGENLDLTLEASGDATYSPDGGATHVSAYQNRQTVFRALSAHDIALRRPEFFAALEGIRL